MSDDLPVLEICLNYAGPRSYVNLSAALDRGGVRQNVYVLVGKSVRCKDGFAMSHV